MSYTRALRMGALGAMTVADQVKAVKRLQQQINRFITPAIPVTGTLDLATAAHAMQIVLQRFTRSFIEDPGNVETRRLFVDANKHLQHAPAWVLGNLEQVISTITDFGDFIGKPAAKTGGASILPFVLIAAGAAVIAWGR
jgi:hypothetical protein